MTTENTVFTLKVNGGLERQRTQGTAVKSMNMLLKQCNPEATPTPDGFHTGTP